jgi:hypothetical protein
MEAISDGQDGEKSNDSHTRTHPHSSGEHGANGPGGEPWLLQFWHVPAIEGGHISGLVSVYYTVIVSMVVSVFNYAVILRNYEVL